MNPWRTLPVENQVAFQMLLDGLLDVEGDHVRVTLLSNHSMADRRNASSFD
jgi:hypothetical protein